MKLISTNLNEKLDFSINLDDFDAITSFVVDYLKDRISVYEKLQSNDFTEYDIKYYIHYFINPCLDDKKSHPYLYRIQHFLSRDYEVFNFSDLSSITNKLLDLFNYEFIDIESFFEDEHTNINSFYDLWNELYSQLKNYPYLMLNSFNYNVEDYVITYSDPNTDEFIIKSFKEFIHKMKKIFPNSLRRIDSFIFCDPSYINFVAGKGTMAYYIQDTVFMPSFINDEDKLFFVETLYHEFMHFIYELLPETEHILWYDYFDQWKDNNIKLTREYDKLDPEELFADVGSYIYGPEKNDFIKKPSDIVIDTFKDIIERGFNR